MYTRVNFKKYATIKQKKKKMLDIEKIKLDIVEKLKPLNPYQIILFQMKPDLFKLVEPKE